MTNDFIRREDALHKLLQYADQVDCTNTLGAMIGVILRDIPAADVRPVLHAHWERVSPDDNYDFRCVCSHCHQYLIDSDEKYDFKYCPNCGAGMDEEVDDG